MKKSFMGVFLIAFVCCFGLLFTPELTEAATSKPVAEKTYNGHRYALYEDAESWTEAKAKCKKLGGHLVTISSAKENTVAYSLYKKTENDCVAIGLYNAGTPEKPKWKWVTGEKFSYENWGEGEPNYDWDGQEAYGGFYWSYMDCWNDFCDDAINAYICEWDYTIKLAESKINLDVNDATYIDYVIEGKKPSGKKVQFKSSNTKVAKVSSKGKVVAKQPGVAKITVKLGSAEKTVTVIVNPKKVTNLKVVSVMKKSIKLSWKKQSGVTKYQVYMYDPDLEEYTKVKTVDADFNTATITGLDANTTYKFKVRAYVKSGSTTAYGDFSKEVKQKTKK
jgi:hypothetical protein